MLANQQLKEEHYIKKELAFLMHNINIYYVKDEYGTNISPHLTNDKIECAVFFTLNQESIRGNLTLNELEKIRDLILESEFISSLIPSFLFK